MFYTDFEPQPWLTNSVLNHVASVNIPDTKIYSIEGRNSSQFGAMIANIATEQSIIPTGGNWKCSDTFHAYWNTLQFNDSMWQSALLLTMPTSAPWSDIKSQFQDTTSWIWSTVDADEAYCRLNLRMFRFIVRV
jgi:hypothetical protein